MTNRIDCADKLHECDDDCERCLRSLASRADGKLHHVGVVSCLCGMSQNALYSHYFFVKTFINTSRVIHSLTIVTFIPTNSPSMNRNIMFLRMCIICGIFNCLSLKQIARSCNMLQSTCLSLNRLCTDRTTERCWSC